MKSEKISIFMILSFILLIASFTIVGSLTMLIIDKKEDIAILRSMGTNLMSIRKIFLLEAGLITLVGALIGLAIGVVVCWLQMQFGLVKLQGSGSFMVDAYPVKLLLKDIVLVLITVNGIGYLASWYPVRYITKKYVLQEFE